MKEELIREVLRKKQIEYIEHSAIYGTIKASAAAYSNGLGMVMHSMKDHILCFGNDGITILPVDDMKGIVREDTVIQIPAERIQSVVVKMKLAAFVLTIRTDQGDIQYKVPRSVLGNPWHKENLSYLLLKLT